jgi:23S rRNA (cytidine1920-2'-O)/16S rRNA (cytidine1409-2'-O)-methyltransferase
MGERADLFLVTHGYAARRAEAQAAIRAGSVRADGKAVLKPAQMLEENARIEYAPAHEYVSRGGVKLKAALDHFELSPENRVCLDIGASTGGFTQVLLEAGARRVYAVDVGHGQLHDKVARDARVIAREGVNARDLTQVQLPEALEAIVADVSFIGLRLALPPSLRLAAMGAWMVALVKPQFEVGRGGLAKGGIVRDARLREEALKDVARFIEAEGWGMIGTMESPITGGDGNIEYLLAAQKMKNLNPFKKSAHE